MDVVRIKDGTYKARPSVMNGVNHATFKKTYRPLSQFLSLPEGFTVKIRNDTPENRKCFLCGGDHFQRECPYRQQGWQPHGSENQHTNINNQKQNEKPENKRKNTQTRKDDNQDGEHPDDQKQTSNGNEDHTTCAKQLYTNNN